MPASTRYGYVMATLPSNLPRRHGPRQSSRASASFLTSIPPPRPAGKRETAGPHLQGGDIVLPGDTSVVLRPVGEPGAAENIGKTIVTSDGTTLLGADDKAGIAIIMTAVQTLLNDPSILHGDIRIAFTPDEEVGDGTKFFDIKAFGASSRTRSTAIRRAS